jgi:hypothetical protein
MSSHAFITIPHTALPLRRRMLIRGYLSGPQARLLPPVQTLTLCAAGSGPNRDSSDAPATSGGPNSRIFSSKLRLREHR